MCNASELSPVPIFETGSTGGKKLKLIGVQILELKPYNLSGIFGSIRLDRSISPALKVMIKI